MEGLGDHQFLKAFVGNPRAQTNTARLSTPPMNKGRRFGCNLCRCMRLVFPSLWRKTTTPSSRRAVSPRAVAHPSKIQATQKGQPTGANRQFMDVRSVYQSQQCQAVQDQFWVACNTNKRPAPSPEGQTALQVTAGALGVYVNGQNAIQQ